MEQLKEKVRLYAMRSNKTYDVIADELGMARTSFYNKLRGQFDFTLDESYRMSRMLGCSLDEFYEMVKAL